MKPSNKEIKQVYQNKLEIARADLQRVMELKGKQPKGDSLQSQVYRKGIKVTIANLNGHIKHCKSQIRKWG